MFSICRSVRPFKCNNCVWNTEPSHNCSWTRPSCSERLLGMAPWDAAVVRVCLKKYCSRYRRTQRPQWTVTLFWQKYQKKLCIFLFFILIGSRICGINGEFLASELAALSDDVILFYCPANLLTERLVDK